MDDNPKMLVISFDSTQQALRAEMLLEYAEVDIDTFPTPKGITAGCALSIQFENHELDRVTAIIHSEHIVIRGIFRQEDSVGTCYTCVWSNAGGN